MGTIAGEPRHGHIYLHKTTNKEFTDSLAKTDHKTPDTFLNELLDLFLTNSEHAEALQVSWNQTFKFLALLSGSQFTNSNDLMKHLLSLYAQSKDTAKTKNTQHIPQERSSNRKRKSQPRRNVKPSVFEEEGEDQIILDTVAEDEWIDKDEKGEEPRPSGSEVPSATVFDLTVVKEEEPDDSVTGYTKDTVEGQDDELNDNSELVLTDVTYKDTIATRETESDSGKCSTEHQARKRKRKEKWGNQSKPDQTVKAHEKLHNSNDEGETFSYRKRKKSDLRMRIVRVQSLSTEKKSPDSKIVASKPVTHVCKSCDVRFKTKMALNLHNYKSHKEAPSTMCINCGRQFELEHQVEIHRSFMCKKLKRKFQCNTCQLKFTTSREKSKHFCTKDPEKPFYCPRENCAFKANKVNILSEHISRHLGIKQYLCVTCGNSFAAKKDLDRHMNMHKPSKDCICQYCGRSYKCPHALRAHLRKHKNKDRYKCEQCSFTSPLYDGYKQHQLKHKARAFKCETCGKCLRSERSLNQHIKSIHTLEQMFACKYCDFTTNVGPSYASHMKKHKNIKDKSESDKESSDTEQPMTDLSSASGFLSPTTYFSISNIQQGVTQTSQPPRSQGSMLPTGSPNQPMLGDPSLHYDGEVNISGQDADTLMANIVSSAEGQDISMITSDAAGTSLNLYSTEAVSNCPSSMALPSLILSESVTTAGSEESMTAIDRKL